MKNRVRFFSLFLVCVLLSSCFNGLKTPKETSVSFYMDEATVSKILQKRSGGRAATDDASNVYIDVTLCSDIEQTKSDNFSSDVKIEFQNILVGTRVYAKAQIYEYEDSEHTTKNVFYRGESSKIIVSEGTNVLTLRLGTAELTVTFESNEGTAIEPIKVITGNAIQEPETPVKPVENKKYSRNNNAFISWCTDEECTKAYNFALPVKDDLTLYAKWLPDFVFVQGGTVNNYLTTGRNLKISDLYVCDHEVTQAEYQVVTNKNPSSYTVFDDLPVENVTWFDAIKYCNLLSEKEGLNPCYKINDSTDPAEWENLSATTQVVCTLSANGYRLPTEAEWEYVAQKAARYNIPLTEVAFYADNSSGKTHQTKFSRADELNLCDILGNVAEWCFDVYSSPVSKSTGPTGPMASSSQNDRVVRGGSYQSYSSDCTPQTRSSANPTEKSGAIGFRVVRSAINEFKVIKNTVTFQTNGGSSVDVQSIVDGDCATQPADPTRTGYIFQNWQFAGAEFDFTTPVMYDIVLEAKWQPITYKIIFDKGLASDTTHVMSSQTFTYDVEQPLSENLFTDGDGYKFRGWSTTAPTEKPSVNVTYEYLDNAAVKNLSAVDGDTITLYAVWIEGNRCDIHYVFTDDSYDISALTPTSYIPSDTITLPVSTDTQLKRTGYTFAGWYTLASGGTQITGWGVNEKSGEITVYGRWTPVSYNINYKNLGADCSWASGYTQPTSYTIEDSVTLPTSLNISRTGYTFEGWYDSQDANNNGTGNAVTSWSSTANKTGVVDLYAKWSPGTVTFSVEHYFQPVDLSTNTDDYEIDNSLTQPSVSGTTGQTTNVTALSIAGFTSQTIAQKTIAADSTTVVKVYYNRKNITYTFARNSTNNETWTSSTDTGTSVTRSGKFGTTVTLPGVERTGYSFRNWVSGEETLTSTSTYGSENKEYTATWDTDTYTLTAYLNGGTISGETTYTHSCSITDGEFTLPTPDTRSGFTFAGWYASSTFSGDPITEIDFTNAANLKTWDIYARWTYTVTFNTYGGSTISTQTLNAGIAATEPSTPPTRTGFTFAGWYSDSSYTTAYTFGSPSATGNFILHAKWTYKVTFESNSGTSVSAQTLVAGDVPTEPSDPTRTGYTFGGWYSNSSLTTAYTFTSAPSTGNMTLYAKWDVVTYTITYSFVNGGDWESEFAGNQTVEYTIEDSVTLPVAANLFKAGYNFTGWYTTQSTGGSKVLTIDEGTHENKTYYARWEIATYTIEYHYQDGSTFSGTNPTTYKVTDSTITLVNPEISNYVFGGWYESESFYGDKVTTIPSGSYGNKEFWAVQSNNIHVASNGDVDNDGLTSAKPVDTIAHAVDKIVEYASSGVAWIIVIDDEITGPQIVQNDGLTSAVAGDLFISGTTSGILNGNKESSTLTINTTFPITITNLSITGGSGTSGYGGGLYVSANSTVKLGDGVKIYGNGCSYGGGVYVEEDAKLYVYGTAVIGDTTRDPPINTSSAPSGEYSSWKCGNYASAVDSSSEEDKKGGGGIYTQGQVYLGYNDYTDEYNNNPVTLSGGIYGNWAKNGGGIAVGASGSLIMKTGNITKNTANASTYGGGGIYNAGQVTLYGGYISSNKSVYYAGGVYMHGNGVFTMKGGNIQDNKGYSTVGAGVYIMSSGQFIMSGGVISGNQNTNIEGAESCAGVCIYGNGDDTVFKMTGGKIENNKDMNGNYTCAIYNGVFKGFSIGGTAQIPYTSSNNNYIKSAQYIYVLSDIQNDFALMRTSTPSGSTMILSKPVDADATYDMANYYGHFNLLNEGWSIGSNGYATQNP